MNTPIADRIPSSSGLLKAITAAVVFLVVVSPSNAAVLANYDFSSGADPSFEAVNTTATAFSAGAFTGGTGSAAPTYSGFISLASQRVVGASLVDPGTEALAVSNNNYFTFTLAADSGFHLDLTSLTFDVDYTGTGGNVSNSTTFFVRSSIDGFATTLGTPVEEVYLLTSLGFTPVAIDLSDASFQNLTDAVTFRIYMFDEANSSNRFARIDNVVLNGMVVESIPEPSAILLTGFAGAFLLAVRKRGQAVC